MSTFETHENTRKVDGKKRIQISINNKKNCKATDQGINTSNTDILCKNDGQMYTRTDSNSKPSPVLYNPDPCLKDLRDKVVKFIEVDSKPLKTRPLTSKTTNSRNAVVKAGRNLVKTLDMLTEHTLYTASENKLKSESKEILGKDISNEFNKRSRINILSGNSET